MESAMSTIDRTSRFKSPSMTVGGAVIRGVITMCRVLAAPVFALFEPLVVTVLNIASCLAFFTAAVFALAATPGVPIGALVTAGVACAVSAALYHALVRVIDR
jgi:hypothetical protein